MGVWGGRRGTGVGKRDIVRQEELDALCLARMRRAGDYLGLRLA